MGHMAGTVGIVVDPGFAFSHSRHCGRSRVAFSKIFGHPLGEECR